jgi:hypothetical protein
MRMTKKKSTAVAKKVKAEIVPVDTNWGYDDEVSAEDILIPKVLIAQKMSKITDDRDAGVAAGDLYKSLDKKLLAKHGDKLTFMPLTFNKTWALFDVSEGNPQYRGYEPVTPENEHLPWDYEEDGKKMRRDKTYNFFVLLRDEVLASQEAMAAGDLSVENVLFPCVVPFTRTSSGTGKQLATHFLQSRMVKKPAALAVFEMSTERKENDKGAFYVSQLHYREQTEPELLMACKTWYDEIRAKKVKIDDSDLAEDTGPTVDVEASSNF